jgi:uncharacterized phage protein (TIGR01671 family)
MNRQILFRGKRIDSGEWVEGNLIDFNGDLYVLPKDKPCGDEHYSEALNDFEVIPETVGQFTGLSDKNGVKVFEGDRVIWHSVSVKIRTIEFENSSFKIILDRGNGEAITYYFDDLKRVGDDIEVIGNIHDKQN